MEGGLRPISQSKVCEASSEVLAELAMRALTALAYDNDNVVLS